MTQTKELLAKFSFAFLFWSLVSLLFLGCASSGTKTLRSDSVSQTSSGLETDPEVTKTIRLKPGDEVEVKFAYAGQFNDTQRVQPDGSLSLQLIGTVMAGGKTPHELRDELMRRYAVELRYPELVVIVRSIYERRVYVGGAVRSPGMVEMPGRLTLLEAIIQTGGIDRDLADAKQVVVIRNAWGDRQSFLLNLEDQVGGEQNQAFSLQPRDVVYVPRTAIADVNLWVKQHIYNLLPPFSFGIGYGF